MQWPVIVRCLCVFSHLALHLFLSFTLPLPLSLAYTFLDILLAAFFVFHPMNTCLTLSLSYSLGTGMKKKNRTVCISLNAIIFVVSHISKAVVDW